MPVFEYTALTPKGKRCKGVIDADSMQMARNRLRDQNLYPTLMQEVRSRAHEKKRLLNTLGSKRLRPKDVSLITRQLATLTGAGFPLVSALGSVIAQTRSTPVRRALSRIKDSVEGGAGFADALAAEAGSFSPIYVNMVRSGESSGTLELVLERLADLLENQEALKSKIQSALAYPVIMALFGGLVLFALMTFIVPGLVAIFADMQQELPMPTRILLHISGFLKATWWILLPAMAALPFGFRMARASIRFGTRIDAVLLRLPIAGNLTTKLAVSRCCRTLASLLANGVPILTALGIVENVVGNKVLAATISKAVKAVERGEGLASSLAAGSGFPDMALQMIQIGERSGNLEAMLEKVADIYQNESQNMVTALTSMLEPVVILIMGISVGLIVLAICLPIFEMNQLIR
ncbi:type II secretion system inner membrane protein GspF [Desulfobotulus sp. H1]|uniref:General secretion pathway protein F n=1 Tax=Desulfobotulus pelophilus TaxID=2823377 RepID=A0ABT3NB70_9BACT|nr:type II secretion system inner membrane protein GspF [Desulfobotulus pelophilus]MCW7754715.1 type II secretion system inner membrane protein GspF [Desulfobotulus pelophilus]